MIKLLFHVLLTSFLFKKKKKNLMIGLLLPYECYMFPEIPSPKYGHKGMGEMFVSDKLSGSWEGPVGVVHVGFWGAGRYGGYELDLEI